MSSVITSLKEISQHYTVFAKDQVLTDSQLNSVSDYLDDQQRLTRTALSGVGIVDGLIVNTSGQTVVLEKGLGITGDGDLFANYAQRRFDRVKRLSEDSPEYAPFIRDGKRLPIWQLVEKGASDDSALALSQVEENTDDWLFILFAESVIESADLCTGTNCDNGSHTYFSRMRLLAINVEFIEFLFDDNVDEMPQAQVLSRVFPKQIAFNLSIDTQDEWFSLVRKACLENVRELQAVFKQFWPRYRGMLQEQLDGNPAGNWQSKLQTFANKAANEKARLQYFYEFLADVSVAWNELIDELEQIEVPNLIGINDASKHLLLGRIGGLGLRSAFVPSPIHARKAFSRLKFLIDKINALFDSFVWTGISSLKVTPSFVDKSSVPGYYSSSVFDYWDYDAHLANRNRFLLGYHAKENKPLGGVDAPLRMRQQGVDFYRVEGCINKSFSTTQSAIRKIIEDNNLPFSVTGVLIEGSYSDTLLPILPFQRELDKFDYLLKKDLSYQLNDVRNFSGSFKSEVLQKSQQETLVDSADIDLGEQVQIRDAEIQTQANRAIAFLQKPALDEEDKVSFNASLNSVVMNAGLFKNDVAQVSTTHFPTMFDQIITSPSNRWIDWLDILRKDEEKEQKEKAQLPNFLKQYPGLELSNGVVRGGTFVLIYNSTGTIVGSAMLSHYLPMIVEKTPVLPELPKFDFPLDNIPLPGIKINPSFETEMGKRFTDFSLDLDLHIDERLANTDSYTDAFRDSLNIVRDIYLPESARTSPIDDLSDLTENNVIDGVIGSMAVSERELAAIDEQIIKAKNDKERKVLESRRKAKQEQMADDLVFVAKYVEDNEEIDLEQSQKVITNLNRSGKAIAGNNKAVNKIKAELTVGDNQGSSFMNNLNASLGAYLGF